MPNAIFAPMKTIALNNLGCSKNIVDGDKIVEYLNELGFKPIDNFDNADIIIVNTCTFIMEANEEAIATILEMAEYKKSGKCSTLVVSGCFSERYREEAKKDFPEVDLWVGVKDWPRELSDYFQKEGKYNGIKRKLVEPLETQYLKISDGCSHNCAFCIIPKVRGKFESRNDNEILAEAAWLEEQGVKELIVVSQDTSYYGRDNSSSLTSLLEKLLAKTSFKWIRMMYLHPNFVDDNLLKLVGSEKRICSYFDIPLQHISDKVLKSMGRAPGSKGLYDLIDRIRKNVPDATIRSSFILGFPGETEKDFKELLKFVEWAKFDKLGVFPFSPEEGTRAYDMRPRPRTTTALKRCETLMSLQKDISSEIQESYIGKEIEVLINTVSDNPDFAFECRSERDAPEIDGRIFLKNSSAKVGDFIKVKIIDADDYDLFA